MPARWTGRSSPRHRSDEQGLRSWALWTVAPRAVRLILAIEAAALFGLIVAVGTSRWSAKAFGITVLLAALSVGYTELAARTERMRRSLIGFAPAHVSMISVWSLAAVLTVPPGYSGVLVPLLVIWGALRRRDRAVRPHRVVYNAATAALSTLGAALALMAVGGCRLGGAEAIVGVVAAVASYFMINLLLVTATIYLAMGTIALRTILPDRSELSLEVGTLVLGVLTAQTIMNEPVLSPLVYVVMLLMQRSSMVSQLEVAATTDAKTGLLNATAWQELAERELLRAQRSSTPCAVLVLDLDHFKRVNDTFGHLAGDAALRAVADALKRELRGYDAVARFGGEEFIVFLDGLRIEEAGLVAERTLARIRTVVVRRPDVGVEGLHLTASIGLAGYPQHGTDLDDLISAADDALYTAKRSGRDRVEAAVHS